MKFKNYDPQTNKFPYTKQTDQHYLKVNMDRGIVFDQNYPYIDNSKKFRFKKFLVRVVLYLLVFFVTGIRMALQVKGKKNLRQNKALLKNGVISVCNHVHMWDFLGILDAIKPFKPYLLTWKDNINGENGTLIRLNGGIPIPTDNQAGMIEYSKTIKKLLENKGWLHIYAEGSMWEYYAPIRPLKRGAAFYACKYHKPILPMAYSYRKPNWLRRHLLGQVATFTLNIGEPLYPNYELGNKAEEDLTIRLHEKMCELAGIEDNIYPPIFNNNERIDYYTDTYGVGYKKSR